MKQSIKASFYAIKAHREVNHKYDGQPYEVHLKMCSDIGGMFINLIPESEIERVFAAIWLHDTIEDCRKTYNDIKKDFGSIVADIVYACTNEKGKTRKERANDKYYSGINETPYANFVKLCDRLANMTYSINTRSRMAEMYVREMPEFFDRLYCHNLSPMFDYMNSLAKEISEQSINS
jgi:(p)ppGpp synthase/HD superfamily hydrolase